MSRKSLLLVAGLSAGIFAMLFEMAVLRRLPPAGDAFARMPMERWAASLEARDIDHPYWYPHVFSGMPAYEGFINTPPDPISALLEAVLVNQGLLYWFYLSLGGAGVFWFIRGKGMGNIPALLGAAGFAFSPYLFGLINASHPSKFYAICYLPWVVLAAERVMDSPTLRRTLLLILATALQLWTKHPQVVYYTWMLIAFRWLWRQGEGVVRRSWNARREGTATLLLAAAVLGAMVIVVDPIVPLYRFQKESTRGAPSALNVTANPDPGASWDYATQWSFHPKESVSFLLPYFYGLQNFPGREAKSAAYWGQMPFTQSTHYVGLVLLLLAVLGVILSRRESFTLSLAVATAIIWGIGLGRHLPLLFSPLYHLAPYFKTFRVPSMIYLLMGFTVPVLAGIGLERALEVVRGDGDGKRRALRQVALIVFGAVSLISLFFVLAGDSLLSWDGFLIKEGETERFGPQGMAQLRSVRLALFQKGALLAVVLSASAVMAFFLAVKKTFSPRAFALLLFGLSAADWIVIDREFLYLRPAADLRRAFQSTPEIEFLLQDTTAFRVLPLDDMNGNSLGYFGISSVAGYRPVKLRTYQDLLDAGGLSRPPVLDMLNVKYVLSRRDVQMPTWEKVMSGRSNIYANQTVLPKAWLVSRLVTAESQKASLDSVMSDRFSPAEAAVVVAYDGPPVEPSAEGKAVVVEYEPHAVSIETESTGGALLVLSENYYRPGWRAVLDGREEIKIYQANHVLRAVHVPAGKHSVAFEYDDTLIRRCRWISRMALALLIAGIGVTERRRWKGWLARGSAVGKKKR